MVVRRKRATRGRPKTLDVQINVRVAADLDERLRRLVERTERSYADIVRRALARGVEALEANPPPA
jgi:predicted DNA-binding protein